jgi:tetratricopeptide (TPR) repeat protein
VRRLLAAAAIVMAGCQQGPASAPAPPIGTLTEQLKREGDELLGQGRYEEAAVKYQRAVNQEPGDLALRYALGVSFSHLQRRQDTVEQFRWLVERGTPDSPYVRLARNWLLDAGEPVSAPASRRAVAAVQAREEPEGTISGATEWAGHDPAGRSLLVRITLTPLQGQQLAGRGTRLAPLGEPFAFRKVPAGKYQLAAAVGDTELWNEEVTVEPDGETVVRLTNANSPVLPDRPLNDE